MWTGTRRELIRVSSAAIAGSAMALEPSAAVVQLPGERPKRSPVVTVLNPRGRVPISLIIDDSTCLVNLNKFAVPQFAAAWDAQSNSKTRTTFKQPWRDWPREIPDDFVRRFMEWSGERGIKGKYSIIPYPACVGRLDRILPGWTAQELDASLKLVRTLVMPNWDIHPEMVTHTSVIDIRTGHPYPGLGLRYQENWDWTNGRSVDELAGYMAYALDILRTVGLPCEGITTPGGFGIQVLPELAQATLESCRSVFKAEIPHYFRHSFTGPESVAPRVEYASGLGGPDPRCVVSIVACTGDWFGGWDCSHRGEVDRFITPDLKSGRMVEIIERKEPAITASHWTGIYFNGEEVGFKVFQEVVRRLHARYDNLIWMKLGEIARYWAAKELTQIEAKGRNIFFKAPFSCPDFTVRLNMPGRPVLYLGAKRQEVRLHEITGPLPSKSGVWRREGEAVTVCFDLPRGESELRVNP